MSLERLVWIDLVLSLTSTLLLGEVPEDLSIPMLLVGNMVVIRRECGQTLARVRVSWTYISIIIISLQRT